MIIDIDKYEMAPPLTFACVDYESTKMSFEAFKLQYPELEDVSELDFFKLLHDKLRYGYNLVDKIQLYMLDPEEAKYNVIQEHVFDELEIGYEIIKTRDPDEHLLTLSCDLIDVVFKNNLDDVILISSDVELGHLLLAIKEMSNVDAHWEVWKFGGIYGISRTLRNDGIFVRNVDVLLFSSLMNLNP